MDRDKREAAARAQAEDLKRERAAEKEKQGAEDRQRREKEPERHSDTRWAAGSAGVWGADGKTCGETPDGGDRGTASIAKGSPSSTEMTHETLHAA